MAPAARRRLRKPVRAPPMEPRGMEVHDVEGQESRGPSGPEGVPEGTVSPDTFAERSTRVPRVTASQSSTGNNPATDNQGGISPSPGTSEDDVGNELRNMLERFEGDIKKVLHAKRKRFITSTNSSVKTINQKIEHVWKTQEEQRQKLYREYSQQFLTLFLEWDISVQKTKEEEEKLANLCHEQQKIFQQARIVQSRRLKKIKNLYDQFLKSMADFEKDHEHLLTDEQSEVRQGMAMLQDTIVMETQQQELAIVRKSLQSLLF